MRLRPRLHSPHARFAPIPWQDWPRASADCAPRSAGPVRGAAGGAFGDGPPHPREPSRRPVTGRAMRMLRQAFLGFDVRELPPNGQGLMALEILTLLQAMGPIAGSGRRGRPATTGGLFGAHRRSPPSSPARGSSLGAMGRSPLRPSIPETASARDPKGVERDPPSIQTTSSGHARERLMAPGSAWSTAPPGTGADCSAGLVMHRAGHWKPGIAILPWPWKRHGFRHNR